MLTPARPRRRDGGFTLIELLVVIAIIAIISAILFPVFFAVREKARQGTAMDNFRQINGALAKYKLDHHQYPAALFGYAVAGQSMSQVKPVGTLYPAYINDPNVFTDPNNTVTDQTQTQTVAAGTLTGGTLTAATPLFYKADAFDANPVVNGSGMMIGPGMVARYQRAWTNFPPPAGDQNNPAAAPRELASFNPPADTFVTCTTYHAGPGIAQGKVLVLFVGGNAKALDATTFLAAAGGTDGPGTTNKFWEVRP